MNKWLSIICLGTLSIYCHAEQKTLTSVIKTVTVYTDRASITRQAEIALPAGEHELYFKNLPVQLDTNSVQVNALSTVPTSIIDVTTKEETRLEDANVRLQKINEEIDKLNDQLNILEDQEKLLDTRQALIEQMQTGMLAPSKDASRPSVQELKSVMQFSKENLMAIFEKQRSLAKQKTDLRKQLKVLQNERLPILRKQGYQVKNVAVRVNLQQAGKVSLNLVYVTAGASWQPYYDARFDSPTNQLAITYLGAVNQRTGEDWRNVKLTLSTTKPSLGGNAPELTGWLLNENVANNSSDYRMAEYSVAPNAAMKKEAPLQEAVSPSANVDTGMTSASFNIVKPISLMSDGSQQKVTITDIKLDSKLHYITVPKFVQAAYLQAISENNSEFPFLAGSLNIFMDGRFVTTSHLKTTMPKEELKLDLGVDEGLAVTYKQLQRFTEKTGITNGYTKVTYEYLITVQNNKKSTETIKVMDHIPVSQDERITVKLLSPNTREITQNKSGEITLNWTLQPSEKKETTLKFSVEYPVDLKIRGL